MKTILLLVACFILMLSENVQAGNSEIFKDMMDGEGFTYAGVQNGFEIYKIPKVDILMRSCDGYSCEGIILAEPISDNELATNVVWVFGPLQDSLKQMGRKAVDFSVIAEHVNKLVKQVKTNLKQANRTEFAYDYLNVRGECYPVSKKEYKAGKRPGLLIKLWIP